jgi:hypothetical protein
MMGLHKLELEKHLPTFAFIEIIQIYSRTRLK